jgi:hypothetical protein
MGYFFEKVYRKALILGDLCYVARQSLYTKHQTNFHLPRRNIMNATITKKLAALVAKNKITPEVQKELDNAAKSVKKYKEISKKEWLEFTEVHSKAARIFLINKMQDEENILSACVGLHADLQSAAVHSDDVRVFSEPNLSERPN